MTRHLLSRSLRPSYRILQADSAEEAIRIGARHQRDIDLLLTDVRLPNLFGWELLELLTLDYPKLKVIYVAKSIDAEIRPHARQQKVLVLEQPFRDSSVRHAVSEVLGNRRFNQVGMKSTAPSLLLRVRSYFRRHWWMHRAAS